MPSSAGAEQPFAVRFFDEQFKRQVASGELALNPFETIALGYVRGETLDLGCGLGNLALEAARRGCTVTAVDASATAVERLLDASRSEDLHVQVFAADVERFSIHGRYDCIVCIGLLMFLDAACAARLMAEMRSAIRPGGFAVVNVLVEGTTFMGMFDPKRHHLFRPGEVEAAFADWTTVAALAHEFPAPGDTKKVFSTVVVRKPA